MMLTFLRSSLETFLDIIRDILDIFPWLPGQGSGHPARCLSISQGYLGSLMASRFSQTCPEPYDGARPSTPLKLLSLTSFILWALWRLEALPSTSSLCIVLIKTIPLWFLQCASRRLSGTDESVSVNRFKHIEVHVRTQSVSETPQLVHLREGR